MIVKHNYNFYIRRHYNNTIQQALEGNAYMEDVLNNLKVKKITWFVQNYLGKILNLIAYFYKFCDLA